MKTRFKVGDRVESSEQAVLNRLFTRTRYGVITRITLDGGLWVRVDGNKQPSRYNPVFWEPSASPQEDRAAFRARLLVLAHRVGDIACGNDRVVDPEHDPATCEFCVQIADEIEAFMRANLPSEASAAVRPAPTTTTIHNAVTTETMAGIQRLSALPVTPTQEKPE